jgi:uncharacterized protein YbjT (DUF2867 family)
MPHVILVTGATGHVGRQVVSQLLGTGAAVRAVVRHPDSVSLPGGVEVAQGDLSVPTTLDTCLQGVEAVFLLWPGLPIDIASAVLDAVSKHARRIVYLSSLSVRDDFAEPPDPITALHADLEQMVERSGLEWTVLRSSGMATNTLGWAQQIRAEGVVRWPYGAAARSLIHEGDIASVAVRVLQSPGHGGAKYPLTGPEALTHLEQVESIRKVIGRTLRYEEISREAARQQLRTYWPPALVDGALDAWASFVSEAEVVTHMVEEVTGTPARSFHQWAIDHESGFR